MPPGPVRVAAAQVAARRGDVHGNVHRCVQELRSLNGAADLVVFPECITSGYVFEDERDVRAAAITITGAELTPLIDACRETGQHCVGGMLELDPASEKVYNTAVLLGPSGVLARYRKAHLPFLGADRFVCPGDDGRPVLADTAVGRIGFAICYDLRFPESARALALRGAHIIVQPSNFPDGARLLVDHFCIVRACENRVFVVVANRPDVEDGVKFIGNSQIVSPAGAILARASEDHEETVMATITPADASEKDIVRVPGEYETRLFRDRRPELYGSLVE